MGSNSKADDASALMQLRQGDKAAFETIFHLYYKPLCSFALRYVNSRSIAEELVQDSLFKLWERRDDFETYKHVSAFLYITTRNACLDTIKVENRRVQRDYHYISESDDVEDAIETQIVEAELLAEIHTAIEQLPPQCRKIFELSFHERLSGREIAELLNISVSTVNNQKARGLAILRKRLSGKGMLLLSLYL